MEYDASGVIFGKEAEKKLPAWRAYTKFIPLLLLPALGLSLNFPSAWLLFIALLLLVFGIQLAFLGDMDWWNKRRITLQWMLRVCSTVAEPDLQRFAVEAARLNRKLTQIRYTDFILPGSGAYFDWFTLANVAHYFRCMWLLTENRDLLQNCYLACANLEADLALATHASVQQSLCWARLHALKDIDLRDAVHPLMAGEAGQAEPLSLATCGDSIFLSGQNGVGKSTLLRTVGLNLLAAQAYGFCYADAASIPALPVRASMQNEDSLLAGESLYLAELRRARELLQFAQARPAGQGGIFLVDEIFRGTNYLESVSAAAAVLHELAGQGLVLVASHHLVLAALLRERYRAVYLSRAASETDQPGQAGRLLLQPGLLPAANGVALLEQQGFAADISANAGRAFQWLNAYLAHPPLQKDILQ
jgi:hypothetical protein